MTSVSPSATAASVPPSLSGLIAAVATPLTAGGGTLDIAAVERIVTLLVDAGVAGVCLGGATAEYPHTTRAERIALIDAVSRRLPSRTPFVVGIGAASPRDVVPLAQASFEAGATAVLLSMPLFLPSTMLRSAFTRLAE